jgi:hypothetical protein
MEILPNGSCTCIGKRQWQVSSGREPACGAARPSVSGWGSAGRGPGARDFGWMGKVDSRVGWKGEGSKKRPPGPGCEPGRHGTGAVRNEDYRVGGQTFPIQTDYAAKYGTATYKPISIKEQRAHRSNEPLRNRNRVNGDQVMAGATGWETRSAEGFYMMCHVYGK